MNMFKRYRFLHGRRRTETSSGSFINQPVHTNHINTNTGHQLPYLQSNDLSVQHLVPPPPLFTQMSTLNSFNIPTRQYHMLSGSLLQTHLRWHKNDHETWVTSIYFNSLTYIPWSSITAKDVAIQENNYRIMYQEWCYLLSFSIMALGKWECNRF
jgi:hypothetical protein